MANYYNPATLDSMRYRTGAPEPSQSYWEKPANVIGARNMIENDPNFDWEGAGIDRKFIYDAYNRMGQANGGRSWWEWDALGPDDPYTNILRQAPEPAPQFQYSPTYKPDYLTQQTQQPGTPLPSGAQLANLPGWQKTMAFIMGNGALQGAAMALPWMVLGGLSGAAVGGPIGGIVGAGGALAAGFLLGFAGDQENQEYARQRLLSKGYSPKFVDFLQNTFNAGFKTLNLPAEWLEQSVGTTAILGNAALPMLPYKIFGYEDMLDEYLASSAETKRMLDNLPAVWDAARNTYEAAATTGMGGAISNLPAGIEWLADMASQGRTDVVFTKPGQVHVLGQAAPVQLDTVGVAILQAAANEIIAGQDPLKVQEKYLAMTGFSGQFADLMYQSLADPLNIVPIAERGLVGKGARLLGNPLLEQAAKQAVGEGLIGTYKQYGVMLRTGQEVAGVAAPAPWKMTKFQRWLADVTPEGVLKELQPGLEGALTRTKRSLFTFSENPLNPITWWSSLSELTPKSKFSMFTGLAQSNWGEILSTYDDVDAMMTDIQRFSSMQPAEAAVLGRQFQNAEMYTILQGQKGYAEKAKRYHDIWKSNEGRRQLLLRISGITGEDYHKLAARIRDGGTRQANTIYRELVNKVQEAQRVDPAGKTPEQIKALEAAAQEAKALLADATFTPEVFKNVASQLKVNPWAFDPGYFKAFIYQDMTNHLEDWAIKSFGVKPENAIVRSGNALKAVQSLLLLDTSPGYAITNVLSNISTRAAEGSFGYLGPQRVKNYLDWIGHQEYRIEAGTAMAGDTRPTGKQRYASAEEAYREGGAMAEAAWIAENSQHKVAAAMRAEDWIQRAHDKVPKGFFMTKASSKAETVDSINVHYTWTMGTFARLWNRNGAIPRMPEGVRQSLASLDPRLPDLIVAGVEAARTKGDISRLLTGITDLSRKADPYIEGVAKSLGIDSPMMREMLAKTNVLERINERLAAGATPEDAVNSVRRDVRAIVRAQQMERVKIAAAAGAAKIRGEGLAAVASSYRDALWAHDEFWTRHFAEWERTYQLAKDMTGPERNQLISERSAIQDQEWIAHNAEIEAMWHGFLRDIGFTQGNLDLKAKKFIAEMAGTHKMWKVFFQERQRRVRKFFKDSNNVSPEYRDMLWEATQKDMAALYDQYNERELEATKRMGLLYLEMWKEQFGEQHLAGAAYWWKGVYDTTARRQVLMADMRAWERGEEPLLPEIKQTLAGFNPGDRHKAWPSFLEKVYLPAIGEITQAHLNGINAVSDAATGRPGHPDWDAALEWFYPRPPQPPAAPAGQAVVPPSGTTQAPQPAAPARTVPPDVQQAVADVQAEIMADTAAEEFKTNTQRIADPTTGYTVPFEVVGNFVYWRNEAGDLYRAPAGSPPDTDGRPNGSRWEAPAHMADNALRMYRMDEEKARQEQTPPWQRPQPEPEPAPDAVENVPSAAEYTIEEQTRQLELKNNAREYARQILDGEMTLDELKPTAGTRSVINDAIRSLESRRQQEISDKAARELEKATPVEEATLPDYLREQYQTEAHMLLQELISQSYAMGMYSEDAGKRVGGNRNVPWYGELYEQGYRSKDLIARTLEKIADGKQPRGKYADRMRTMISERLAWSPGYMMHAGDEAGALKAFDKLINDEGLTDFHGTMLRMLGGDQTLFDDIFDRWDRWKSGEYEPFDPNVQGPGEDLPALFQRKGKPAPGQLNMFAAGEDLPLFSGAAQRAQESVFAPQVIDKQAVLPGFDMRPQMKGAEPKPDPRDTPGFREWMQGNQLVDKKGDPIQLYHGTFADFTQFQAGSPEAHWGDAIYLTNNPEDASLYASKEGPDWKSKIESEMDRLGEVDDWYDYADDLAAVLGEPVETIQEWIDTDELSERLTPETMRKLAERRLEIDQSEGLVMPVIARMERPLDMTKKDERLTYEIEETEDGDIISESGSAVDFIQAIRDAAYEVGDDGRVADAAIGTLLDEAGDLDGLPVSEAFEILRNSEDVMMLEGEWGADYLMLGSQFLQLVARNMGYDGVIMSAWDSFGPRKIAGGHVQVGPMKGIDQNTRHYIVFKDTHVKSIANRGTYSLSDPNILYHAAAKQLGAGAPVPINQAVRTDPALVREPKTLAEVYPPALIQLGWTRDKKGTRALLNAINKDRAEAGLEKYKSAADVPWSEAKAAIAKRVQPPDPAAESRPIPEIERLTNEIRAAFPDYSEQQVQLAKEILSARADAWAKNTGKDAGEWLKRLQIRPATETDPSKMSRDELWQMKAPPDPSLVALHNVFTPQLLEIAALGGMPAPSFAVTGKNIPHESFGDITLIGNRQMIDPEYNRENRVFSADIFSPTIRSSVEVVYKKLGSRQADKLMDRFRSARKEIEETGYYDNYYNNLWDALVNYGDYDKGLQAIERSPSLMLTFLREKGVEVPEFQPGQNARDSMFDYVYDLERAIKANSLESEFRSWGKEIMSALGPPMIKLKGKKVPYTLNNILEALVNRRNIRGAEEGLTFGPGRVRAEIAKEFKNVGQMHRAEGSLATTEEFRRYKKEVQEPVLDRFQREIGDRYTHRTWQGNIDYWRANDEMYQALVDWMKRGGSDPTGTFGYYGFKNLSDDDIALIQETARVIRDAPTEYFEGKPERIVRLSEFAGAAIPKDTPADVRAVLDQANIRYVEYDESQPGSRQAAVESFYDQPGVLFQRKGSKTTHRSVLDAMRFAQEGEAGEYRGAVQFGQDGQAIISAFQSADISTLVHEIGHVFRRDLTGADHDLAARWAGATRDEATGTWTWTREAEEKFADGFVKYLEEGYAPTPRLKQVFERFKTWLTELYQRIAGTDISLDDNIRGVFERLLGGEGRPRVTVQRYLESRTIAGKPIIGAAYVDGKFAAYIPYRFDIGRVMDTAQGPARILGVNADGAWVYRIENSGQVKVLQDGDDTIPVAGPMAPGTMEANGATPMDEAAMWADGMANYVDPVLDELLAQMKAGQAGGGGGQGLDLSGLSVSDRANFSRWIEQTAGAMSRAKMTSIRVGDMHRDLALLDYNKRYGFDNAVGLVFPYQFWFTRSMLNWSLRFADRPGMLAFFARLAQFKDENVDDQFKEIPSRLKGKVRIPVPFLNSIAPWAGGSVYVDPWGKLFPYREFLRPWERYLQDNTRIRRKAEQYIRQWADLGEIDAAEAQQAVDSRAGALWDRAYAAAQENEEADAVDYLSLISSPNLALSMMVRGPGKTGPFPMSRMLQGLSAATGWDGLATLDPEAKLRKNAKLSEFGEWGVYYVDRMLVNLVADGEISARDAEIAMIERQGPAFDKAMERTRLELALREPTMLPVLAARNALQGDGNLLDVLGAALIGLIPGGLLPTGELKLRGLYDDYSQAWARKNSGEDPEAVNNFFKAHPEYEARLALYDEPQDRMRQFLVGEIWDRWTKLPELYRNAARDELGQDFKTMFLNSETRDTDGISVDKLASWAQQLGGYAPGGSAPAYAAPMQFQGGDAAAQYEQMKAQLFPGIGDILNAYYKATDDQKAMLKQQYPEIQGYYNWRDTYIAQNPELIQYAARSDPELAAADPETAYLVYMYRAEKARIFPDISMILDEYYALPTKQRKQYAQARTVGQYYDWEKQMLQQFPQIARFVKGDKSAFETLYGKDYAKDYGTPVNVYAWPAEVQASLAGRFTRNQSLSAGARSYLYYQWEKSGKQLGSFEKWLDTLGVYYGR